MRGAAAVLGICLALAVAAESGFDGRVIVKLRPECRGVVSLGRARFGIAEFDRECARLGVDSVWPLFVGPVTPAALKHGCDLAYGMHLGADPSEAVARFRSLSLVEWAGPDEPVPVCEAPDDSLFPSQWHLARIGAAAAWDIGHGDTSVVIGLVDNGYEWHHPDIEANIRVNNAEDLNHNGRFDTLPPPAGDLDGIDQDSNDVADDVVGYNFAEDTPDPAPESVNMVNSHGTHTWGIANAVTNNRVGVAGVAWNCRAVGCRAGTGQLMLPSAVISSIYYLVALGAKVLSLSFGSNAQNQPMEDACNFAWDSGRLIVAGAGNNGDTLRFYPAAYDRVTSVAGSDEADMKPYWSNYGTWVDVTAPGNSILSTIAGHGYGVISGTSMATPLTAGALAWIWSRYPGFTNAQVESTLFAACEPMPDTLYSQGLLGHGRISTGMVALPLLRCDLRLSDWRLNDASGNSNGRLDPGETAAIIATYANASGWRDASQVRAGLSCDSRDVVIVRGAATFPDILAGASANCSADSFVVTAPDSMPSQMVVFRLHAEAEPTVFRPDTSFSAECGNPRVLVVDDDCGEDYEQYYTAACDSNRLVYRVHDWLVQGAPPAETLRQYPVVVWFCGDDSLTTLQPEDRSALSTFLRNGGNLFLSGQSVAYDLDKRQSSFLPDYLRAEFVADSVGQPFLVGYPDDPITQGDTFVVAGAGGANNGRSLDGIRPIGGALACARFRDYSDTTVCCLTRYVGAYRLAFLSIPFEAVDHSPTRYLQRWTMLRRVLDWFGERVPGVGSEPERVAGRFVVAPTLLRPGTAVSFIAPFSGTVRVRICSAAGRLVQGQDFCAVAGRRERIVLDQDMAAGVYVVLVGDSRQALGRKIVLTR